jgi:hypothetical protein
MSQTKLFLVQFLIEADVSEWPDFDEIQAAEHFRSGLNLSSEDKLLRSQIFLLARKPDDLGDLVIEDYEDRGYRVEICQDAETVGTDVPSYFLGVYNLQSKNPSSSITSHLTLEEAREAARLKVDKNLERRQRPQKH